jgi:hypothetical protein
MLSGKLKGMGGFGLGYTSGSDGTTWDILLL